MRRAGMVIVVLVAALAGYGQLLSPRRIVASPYSDLFAYHLSAKAALRHSLQRGESLLWREDHLSGEPGLTHPQASWGNPLHALFWLVAPERAVGPTFFLLFVVTAGGFWQLAAALGLRWPGRALAAFAGLFQIKLILVAYAGWLGVLPSLALLPWLFWALALALERPGLAAGVRLAGVAALLLHCGQLQLPYYAALWATAWVVAHLVRTRGRGGRPLLATVAGAALLALAAAAWLLAPLALEAPLLTRVHASWSFFAGGNHVLEPRQLSLLLRPEILGTPLDRSYPGLELWEDEAYFGVVPLAGCLFVLVFARKQPWTRLLAISFITTLLLAFDTPLLHAAFYGLPGFRLFRCPSRLLFLSSLFGVMLGAAGLDATLARVSLPWRRILTAAALLLMGAEGTHYARRYLITEPLASALPASAAAALIEAEPGRFRTALIGFPPRTIWPVRPARLMQVGGFDTYGFSHYRDYFERMRSGAPAASENAGGWFELDHVTQWPLLDALAVRFVVTPKSLTLPSDHFELVDTFEHEPCFLLYRGIANAHVRLWRNRFARPFTEVWHPGWRASANDVPIPVQRIDGALAGVAASVEPSQVTLQFRPLAWPLAPIVSLLAAAALLAGGMMAGYRRFKSRGVSS
jgi:hypothetical protein